MLPIRTILHPTDFSNRSENAFRLACALAGDYHAQLVLLHVARRSTFFQISEEHEYDLLSRLWSLPVPDYLGPACRRLEEGSAADEILRVAEVVHADLIVMGAHDKPGLNHYLLGSVSEQVARQAKCPVLTATIPYFSLPPDEMGDDPTNSRKAVHHG